MGGCNLESGQGMGQRSDNNLGLMKSFFSPLSNLLEFFFDRCSKKLLSHLVCKTGVGSNDGAQTPCWFLGGGMDKKGGGRGAQLACIFPHF